VGQQIGAQHFGPVRQRADEIGSLHSLGFAFDMGGESRCDFGLDLAALSAGSVDAVTSFEPYITVAEKEGIGVTLLRFGQIDI
jgi:ABC-type nitrate/sulfonate/bicarbonate transport system substrate-binding protein